MNRKPEGYRHRTRKGFPNHNDRKGEVKDTLPAGENTLNRKSEDILHRMLNGFPSRNGGRRKDTGKRSKYQYASVIGMLHASGGEMIWEPQRRKKKDYGFQSNKIDARSIEKLSA